MADEGRKGTLAPNGAYIPITPTKRKPTLWEAMCSTPYVTAGLATTVAILVGGVFSMKLRNKMLSNYIMRARILSQAITIGFVMSATGVITWTRTEAHKQKEALILPLSEDQED